jgi:hypothetical protein
MKLQKYLLGLSLLCISVQVLGWGQTGHRVTGAIAEQYLTPEAKIAIEGILLNEDLAEASTWADEMRSNPELFWQKTSSPWHYVSVPQGINYVEVGAPDKGDAYSALDRFASTLKDPKTSMTDKQLALRFIVHIIGDLHQPMHAGNGTDRGGNDVKLKFMCQDSNLHRVWDSGMIDHRGLSYTEWTARLSRKMTAEQVKSWMEPDPLVWIAESIELRDKAYPEADEISWDYIYQHVPTATLRLQMGGVRIAGYLNMLFSK